MAEKKENKSGTLAERLREKQQVAEHKRTADQEALNSKFTEDEKKRLQALDEAIRAQVAEAIKLADSLLTEGFERDGSYSFVVVCGISAWPSDAKLKPLLEYLEHPDRGLQALVIGSDQQVRDSSDQIIGTLEGKTDDSEGAILSLLLQGAQNYQQGWAAAKLHLMPTLVAAKFRTK